MVKHSNKLKRKSPVQSTEIVFESDPIPTVIVAGADRRAPDPGLQVDFEPTASAADKPKPAEPFKPFQHAQAQPSKKRTASTPTGKAARDKKLKAIERADKTNQKFTVNKAKAERKKLMKS